MFTGVKDNYVNQDYSLILDESLSVGKQKLLVQLAVPTSCTGKPLSHSNVDIVGLAVQPSWKNEEVKNAIEKVSKAIGHNPEYIISDNAGNLCKACEQAGIPHHSDISHYFGNMLKKHFSGTSDFKEFTKTMEKKRLSYHLTDKAILLPPKQRAIARFMNISNWVEWANNILSVYHQLTHEQQEACSYVVKYRGLIKELYVIIDCMNYVEQRCKSDGLSLPLYNFLTRTITKRLVIPRDRTERMLKVGLGMWEYLKNECALITSPHEVHIISSDIIESCFGIYKTTKSPDKLCGVTRHVLALPLFMKFTSSQARLSFDFKKAMENVHYRDLKQWKELNLYENPAQERIKIIRKTA